MIPGAFGGNIMPRSLLMIALVAVLVAATQASADRVPSRKVEIVPSSGSRIDITVPYVTNGRSTLGVWNGVAPKILSDPGLGNRADAPQARPVTNIIYYGSTLYPNSEFGGAMPRKPNQLRPTK
jgi:hypothetical protein